MKKTLLVLTAVSALFTACKIDEPDKDLQRTVFDQGNLKFISTSLNTKKETASALYGNQEALKSLTQESSIPEKGSVLKFVTWKYHENPQYTGGTITGELLSVETLQADQDGKISYQFKDQSETKNDPPDKESRIRYLMSYRPVSRP